MYAHTRAIAMLLIGYCYGIFTFAMASTATNDGSVCGGILTNNVLLAHSDFPLEISHDGVTYRVLQVESLSTGVLQRVFPECSMFRMLTCVGGNPIHGLYRCTMVLARGMPSVLWDDRDVVFFLSNGRGGKNRTRDDAMLLALCFAEMRQLYGGSRSTTDGNVREGQLPRIRITEDAEKWQVEISGTVVVLPSLYRNETCELVIPKAADRGLSVVNRDQGTGDFHVR